VFHPVPFFIEVSQIILQEADQPDLVIDLTYAHGLSSEHGIAHIGQTPTPRTDRLCGSAQTSAKDVQ